MVDKNERIAIIGGGPAGLSAGMYLEKAGFENYVIFERNGWVGGKCHSPNYKGRRYEMGAIMGVPSYYAVHDVEEFCARGARGRDAQPGQEVRRAARHQVQGL